MPGEGKLLIVDDNEESLKSLDLAFTRSGYDVLTASSGKQALQMLDAKDIDVMVCDLRLPDISGIEVLQATRNMETPPSVILLTAYGTIESAVEALRAGALNYLTKPVNLSELRIQVQRAMEHQRLKKENVVLRRQLAGRAGFDEIVGESPEIRKLLEQLRIVADTAATVLVEGESGTGKELVARAIHKNSRRANKPFIPIHCGALCETLVESELFGYEKGAFTGATTKKAGLIELADGGTLFLDEIGEIPLATQVKLLRVLETREFMHVGGTVPHRVDIRIIAATNRNLQEEVEEGRFREDLYYRLNVVKITVPPLRTRRSDIPLLVAYFLREFAKEHGKPELSLTQDALQKLQAYHWPGNVRQLRNTIETLVIFAQSPTITAQDLPPELLERPQERLEVPLGIPLDELERQAILRTLESTSGNRTQAAAILGISRRTLIRRLKELGIET
ncbi:MAG: sigma-54-dependent transcriptional regulator [Candidatus Sumerlaeaceae bacterium]|jgi:DNA-binding NtrC family response regulator